MYCVKCGNAIENDQQFCTKCGEPVEGTITNEENYDVKKNIDIEEASTRIVTEVTDTVNNFVDKSKDVVNKIKTDDKINQYANTIKQKPNTIKVVGAIAAIVIILIVGYATLFRSTPTKTVNNFAKSIQKLDVKKALSYTNFESMADLAMATEYLGVDKKTFNAYKDKMIAEFQQEFYEEFYDEFMGVSITVNSVQEVYKSGNYAKVMVNVTVIQGRDMETESVPLELVKQKGKWLIKVDDLGYYW